MTNEEVQRKLVEDSGEIKRLQKKVAEMEQQRSTRLLSAGLALVGILVALSINLFYTKYTQQQSDRRWCALIVSLDDRYRAIPNPAPEATAFQRRIHDLRQGLGCKDTTIVVPPPPPARSSAPTPGDGN